MFANTSPQSFIKALTLSPFRVTASKSVISIKEPSTSFSLKFCIIIQKIWRPLIILGGCSLDALSSRIFTLLSNSPFKILERPVARVASHVSKAPECSRSSKVLLFRIQSSIGNILLVSRIDWRLMSLNSFSMFGTQSPLARGQTQ